MFRQKWGFAPSDRREGNPLRGDRHSVYAHVVIHRFIYRAEKKEREKKERKEAGERQRRHFRRDHRAEASTAKSKVIQQLA